jgi:hypothetical protein
MGLRRTVDAALLHNRDNRQTQLNAQPGKLR